MNDYRCKNCGKPAYTYVDDTTDEGNLCHGCYQKHERRRRENVKKLERIDNGKANDD